MIKSVVGDMLAEQEKELINTVNAILIIRKPDLIGNSKWGFVFDRNIEATIEDKEWLEKVREDNVKFGKGMKLPVQLRIAIKLDERGEPISESTYTVLKVTGDIIEDNSFNQVNMQELGK